MFEKTKVAGVCLALVCQALPAQTIDQLTELQRQAEFAEAEAKVANARKAKSPVDQPMSTPGPQGIAPGFTGLQGAAAAPAAAPPAWKPITPKKERAQAPALVAIYGVGKRLTAELSESGFDAKYREGDKTPGGWTIDKIEKRNVEVSRAVRIKGSASKIEQVSLPFGIKNDLPKETVQSVSESPAGNYSMPPLPPSFATGRY